MNKNYSCRTRTQTQSLPSTQSCPWWDTSAKKSQDLSTLPCQGFISEMKSILRKGPQSSSVTHPQYQPHCSASTRHIAQSIYTSNTSTVGKQINRYPPTSSSSPLHCIIHAKVCTNLAFKYKSCAENRIAFHITVRICTAQAIMWPHRERKADSSGCLW